jgi:DNA mismatch repair protein MutL
MPTIQLLSDALIDQIAAGEVVERPASVVKELGENALDAGARSVQVLLEAGGTQRIEVLDDGSGMGPEDAVLCVRRHATSKLRTAEDLLSIGTLGFRGEALAAIASVSRLLLRTALPGAPEGTEVVVYSGGPPVVGPSAARPGTQVRVEELFGTVPARRKFLRRPETELRHCEEAVLRLALAHPAVAFRLDHDGRTLRTLPPCGTDVAERIALALGPEVAPFLLPFDERRLNVRVHGVIAAPEFTLSTARSLFAFVNGRHVRDRTLHFAVHRGLSPLLPAGRQPVGVVFVELDPARVDVNVHPQKLEVRFADPAAVTEAVQAALGGALRRSAAVSGAGSAHPPTPEYALAVERFLSRASAAPLPLPEVRERAGLSGPAGPDRNSAPAPGFFAALRPLGCLAGRAVVCEGPGSSLVVLDLHAARERVLAARLDRELPRVGNVPLLGAALALRPDLEPRARRLSGALRGVGIGVEPFGPGALRLVAVPPTLVGHPPESLVEAAVEALEAGRNPSQVRGALACVAAGDGHLPSEGELRALLGELEQSDPRLPVTHGQVVIQETPLLALLP